MDLNDRIHFLLERINGMIRMQEEREGTVENLTLYKELLLVKHTLIEFAAEHRKRSPRTPKDARQRKSRLLDLMQTRKAASIKDIAAAVRHVSERSLRRDLEHLVKEKKLRCEWKNGLKIYSIWG